MTLRLATICSGIGAPECAADVIGGFEHVFVSEIEDFPSAYVLRYTPRGVDTPGWHDLAVSVTRPGSFSIRARKGYERRTP